MPEIHFMEHKINRERNTIDGYPVQFGNDLHIKINQQYSRVMSSQDFVCELEWSFRQYYYNGPKYFYKPLEECDSMVAYVPCICCGRLHRLVTNYDPHLHYQSLVEACNFSFQCWNCGQEYFVDDEDHVWAGDNLNELNQLNP